MTHAFHSLERRTAQLHRRAGRLRRAAADGKRIYFAGDTCVFGDMQLIARLYQPDVAVLPIGDHFTMGPEEAAARARAAREPALRAGHWGTFPLLTGTPDKLATLTAAQVERIEPGETVQL